MNTTEVEIIISEEFVGKRLDIAICAANPSISRSKLQHLFKTNSVFQNNVPISSYSKKVTEPCEITIMNLDSNVEEYEIIPENIPIDIIFEDEHIIVLNKKSGIVCHPSIGHKSGTLVNALRYHFQNSLSDIVDKTRPGIIHRLDKDTSGLLIVAKTNEAHLAFSEMFASAKGNLITRKYLCFVFGVPSPKNNTIENFITRHPKFRQEYTTSETNGKKSITIYKTLKSVYFTSTKAISMLECELLTGRTHQIRVHMKHIGHHVIGDSVYGKKSKVEHTYPEYIQNFSRQALHSHELSFVHPFTKESLTFSAKLPDELEKICELF